MWIVCIILSVGCLGLASGLCLVLNRLQTNQKRKIHLFHSLFVGVFAATLIMFIPIHLEDSNGTLMSDIHRILLCIFHSMQVFTMGCDYTTISDGLRQCPSWLNLSYQIWGTILYVLAPIFTFGFVLSLFKNISAYLRYFHAFFKDLYVFSELNEKSLTLACDIKKNDQKAVIVFTDVFEENEESVYEIVDRARKMGAICFKKDLLTINFNLHSKKRQISVFAIGDNETENLNQSLRIIEVYKSRSNTRLYVFSARVESELLLTSVDKGEIKVRRINHVQSLINRVLYENGELLFNGATPCQDGTKEISAVVVGMGRHGTEMVKALAWYCQMDGYKIEINTFDQDDLAEEKFIALAPELMAADYNGVMLDGEAQYKITVHSGIDVQTAKFANEIRKLKNATYVLVALGNDDINISTAVTLRMLFERMGIHPVIQAIVYNTQQKKALTGIRNYRGQLYDIDFIGDLESYYTEDVIIDSALEAEALQRHLKWGKEEEFWTYEYNYRSSVASAIHMRARIRCGIPGASKKEDELTDEERTIIETLEHRRWNAYMRAEGYVFSGSKDKSSRNDLAKMHHDLVDYASLAEDVKRLDSKVGTM